MITDNLEQVVVPAVSGAWKSVSFENSYAQPIPICVGQVGSNANWTPVVRLRNVSATGMQVRVQKLANAANDTSAPTVAVNAVHCVIADAGDHDLPDGPVSSKIWFQAGKHTVSNTYGSGAAADGWQNAAFDDDIVSASAGLNGAYAGSGLGTKLGVVAQIMTSNDAFGQVVHVNDCESRANNPFQGGFSDGVCIGRHISQLAGEAGAPNARAAEEIGYIIFRTGNGDFTNTSGAFDFSGGVTSDSVRSVDDNPPYSYGTGATLDGAVATQQAEDGGNGSYVGLYGNSPFNGANIDLALDEGVNSDRNHTTEFVAWFGFRKLAFPIDVQKAVDTPDTTGFPTVNYTMTVENTSPLPILSMTATDVLTQGPTTLPLTSGPTLTDPNNNGILDVGETWTYVATYKITETNYDAGGGSLLNTFEVSGPLLVTQSATATTLIPIDPDLNVTKTALLDGGAPLPAGGASVGDVIEYTYTVRNSGNVAMTSVKLDDDHLGLGDDLTFGSCTITQDKQTNGNSAVGSVDFQIQTLAPRDTVTCTATYTVVQADIDNLQTP